jgi:hypothetical protein
MMFGGQIANISVAIHCRHSSPGFDCSIDELRTVPMMQGSEKRNRGGRLARSLPPF